jgi:hypothetical protein
MALDGLVECCWLDPHLMQDILTTVAMKANRIHVFGGPEVILFEDVPRPTPGTGEVLVRVHAAGVGPWDASVRAERSAFGDWFESAVY